jgi:hypothetical protein
MTLERHVNRTVRMPLCRRVRLTARLGPTSSLDFDFHRVANEAHPVRGDVFRRGVDSDATGLDIEVRRVPRTLDFLAADCPFGEGATLVGTVVINGVDLAAEVYECEAFALDLHTDHAGLGDLRPLGDFDKPAHLLALAREWYLLVRCKLNNTTVI